MKNSFTNFLWIKTKEKFQHKIFFFSFLISPFLSFLLPSNKKMKIILNIFFLCMLCVVLHTILNTASCIPGEILYVFFLQFLMKKLLEIVWMNFVIFKRNFWTHFYYLKQLLNLVFLIQMPWITNIKKLQKEAFFFKKISNIWKN